MFRPIAGREPERAATQSGRGLPQSKTSRTLLAAAQCAAAFWTAAVLCRFWRGSIRAKPPLARSPYFPPVQITAFFSSAW